MQLGILNKLKAYAKKQGYGAVSFTDMGQNLYYGANSTGLPLIQYKNGQSYFLDYGQGKNIKL